MSPSSIPRSTTKSVHAPFRSWSVILQYRHSPLSGIFEPDIGPITFSFPPHPHHPFNVHMLCSQVTEQLDQSIIPSRQHSIYLPSTINSLDDRISVVSLALYYAIIGNLGGMNGVTSPDWE